MPALAAAGGGIPRNMTNGRDLQAMQTSMFGIQEPVRRIAESTGGQAFGRASDLGHTLDTILTDTQATYMASFKPDSAPDDTFHTIVLKVTGQAGSEAALSLWISLRERVSGCEGRIFSRQCGARGMSS